MVKEKTNDQQNIQNKDTITEKKTVQTEKKIHRATKNYNKKITELKEKIKKIEEEKAQYLDLARRTQAEFENFKKRSEANFRSQIEFEHHKLVKEFLIVYDNLGRAIEAANKTKNFDDLNKGIQMIAEQFKKTLTQFGVEEIASLGEEFDPNIHEALMMQESDDVDKEIVAQIFEHGYKLNGKVVRHAKVIVHKPKETQNQDSENKTTESDK